MIRLPLAILAAAVASPALAAADPHAGHDMPPAPSADPHAGHGPAQAADPHAGHDMSAMAATAALAAETRTGAELPVGNTPPPPPPADHAADAVFGAAAMAPARDLLAREHGRVRFSKTMLDMLELRTGDGSEGYAWQGEFRYGGDINRLALKSEGEGDFGGDIEQAEVQALYSRALTPYFDLQLGVRQDFEPRPARTYATVAVEGLAPYWFDVEGALFLSHKGELSARFEGAYDLRLTQRLVLQPRAELNLAAQDTPALGVGAGFTDAEVGVRLRYEIRREFAPYIGLNSRRRLGETADFARAAGSKAAATQVVVGVRAWF